MPLCRLRPALFLCLFVGLVAVAPALADIQKDFTYSSRSLTVTDMIGEITITAADGPDFEVTVRIRGADAEDQVWAACRRLAALAAREGRAQMSQSFGLGHRRLGE